MQFAESATSIKYNRLRVLRVNVPFEVKFTDQNKSQKNLKI